MKVKKILATIMALALSSTLAIPALAATSHYNAVSGGTVKVEKYLTMKSDAQTPAVTFSFDITPGSAIAAASGKMEVKAGNNAAVSGTPTIGTAVFTAGQTTYSTAQSMATTGTKQATQSNDPVDLTGGKIYAKSEATVSFANVTFGRPGIYRWVVTEQANADAAAMGITNDANNTRYLDVYVIDNNGSLEVEGYVLHTDATFQPSSSASVVEPTNGKAKGYVNDYETENLTLTKTVAGSQGDKDDFFKFDITITDAGNGTKMAINSASGSYDSYPTEVVADASGTATTTLYLRHGDSVVIKGLPKNAKYTITETSGDYTVTTASTEGTGSTSTGSSNIVSDTNGITGDTSVIYTNTRNGIIPTGHFLNSVGFYLLVAVGCIGFCLITVKQKKTAKP